MVCCLEGAGVRQQGPPDLPSCSPRHILCCPSALPIDTPPPAPPPPSPPAPPPALLALVKRSLRAWLEWVTTRVRWLGQLWYRMCMICTAVSVLPVPAPWCGGGHARTRGGQEQWEAGGMGTDCGAAQAKHRQPVQPTSRRATGADPSPRPLSEPRAAAHLAGPPPWSARAAPPP